MPLLTAAAGVGGWGLAAIFGTAARLRGTRALHPVGRCGRGTLRTQPPLPPSGVPWLDHGAEIACDVRWSHATGRRRGHDVHGLALRLEGEAEGDLLLASTGTGRVGRFVLALREAGRPGPMTTLIPMRTAGSRSVLLRLDPSGPGEECPSVLLLSVAAPGGDWRPGGVLTVEWEPGDCARRHDPVGHPPSGLSWAPWWAALRDPSYRASQQVSAQVRAPLAPTPQPVRAPGGRAGEERG